MTGTFWKGGRRWTTLAIAAAIAGIVVAALPAIGGATGEPVPPHNGTFAGNINGCTGDDKSVEGDPLNLAGPWIGGSSGDWDGNDTQIDAGGLVVDVDSTHSDNGQLVFHWTSNLPVDVAVVKQGNGGAYWVFNPGQTSGWLAAYKDGEPSDGISHVVFCAKPKLVVTKTAETEYTRTHTWDVEKTATPASATTAVGGSVGTTWKVVLDETETLSGWKVSGTISVKNASPTDTLVSLSDTLAGATLTLEPACVGAFMVTKGSTVECDYSATYASNPGLGTLTNTAYANAESAAVQDGSGSVDFSFANADVNVVGFPEVEMDDTLAGRLAHRNKGDLTVEYEKTYTCEEPGEHVITNTVTVHNYGNPVLDTDTATFTLTCVEPKKSLRVSPTAVGEWHRSSEWSVEKTVDPSSHNLDEGDGGTSTWMIDVTKTSTSWFVVSGTITVENPNAFAVTGVQIEESLADAIVDFDCGEWEPGDAVPAGETVECDYVAVFETGQPGVNVVTVTTDDEELGGEASAQFSFPQTPTTDLNAEVTIDDPYLDDSWTATNSEDGDAEVEERFTCDGDEGQHTNTVYVLGDDPQTEQVEESYQLDSASATVTVTCKEPPVVTPHTPTPTVTTPPAPKINIGVVKTATPQVALNANATFTLTVTSNGDTAADGVTVGDPAPAGFVHQTATATNGATCQVLNGGGLVTCERPGPFAPGASFVVTIMSKATQTGTITNTATVATKSAETTLVDNASSAPVLVVAASTPPAKPKPKPTAKPAICADLTVAQKSVTVGKKNKLTMAVKAGGKAVKGAKITVKGPGIDKKATTNAKGIAKVTVSPKTAGIITISVTKPKSCSSARRVGVVGAFEPPVTG